MADIAYADDSPLGDVLIIQSASEHGCRVQEYFEDMFPATKGIKTDGDLTYLRVPNNTASILDHCFKDDGLHRILKRFYIVQQQGASVDLQKFLPLEVHNLVLRLMIYPRKSEESIALSIVAQGYKVHPKVFDRVLCIVHDEKDNLYYYGLAPSKYIYSPENAIHSVAGKNVSVSRAYFKIREVFERCPRLRECASGADKVAVDVGAAPGGWSHYLSEKFGKVYAIDPAEMVVKHDRITHLQMRGEEAAAIFKEENLVASLLVCDMNLEPELCLQILDPLLEYLVAGGYLVLTLKLRARTQAWFDKKLAELEVFIQQRFPRLIRTKYMYLLSNSNCERTALFQLAQ